MLLTRSTSNYLRSSTFTRNISSSIRNSCSSGAGSVIGMDPSVEKSSKISREAFKNLANYSLEFMRNNRDQIMLEKNESGFVRISIPIDSFMQSQIGEISKIRLNFWSPDTGLDIVPESIHSHPAYFESIILKGGYTHELFELSEDQNDPEAKFYQHYKIFKQLKQKSFAFMGENYLTSGTSKFEPEGAIVAMPIDAIHRVLESQPKTLTLNAVWKVKANTEYDLFLTPGAPLDNIKTQRKMVASKQSKEFIEEIAEYLNDYTKKS